MYGLKIDFSQIIKRVYTKTKTNLKRIGIDASEKLKNFKMLSKKYEKQIFRHVGQNIDFYA